MARENRQVSASTASLCSVTKTDIKLRDMPLLGETVKVNMAHWFVKRSYRWDGGVKMCHLETQSGNGEEVYYHPSAISLSAARITEYANNALYWNYHINLSIRNRMFRTFSLLELYAFSLLNWSC
jgi:hypothetical protein